MERWKTLSRRDPEFLSVLDGRFSEAYRAVPVRSLNVDSMSEQVTFEIIPVHEIRRPSLAKLVWQMMRPPTLALSFSPMAATLALCWASGDRVIVPIAIASFFGVLFFQVALNLFNDYFDHIKGQDRLKPRGGSRAIQKGWVRALDIKRAAWGLLGLAVLFGIPVVAMHFSPLAVVAFLALLTGLEFASQKLGLKYKGFGELMAFALTGPLLTAGYAWAITGEFGLTHIALGCVFGAISLMYFHSSNFENIMPDSQAGVVTWATRTGFDASQTFFYFTAALTLVSTAAWLVLFERDLRLLPVLLAQVLFLVPVCMRVRSLASPLSSELVGLRNEALKLNALTLIALLGGLFWIATQR